MRRGIDNICEKAIKKYGVESRYPILVEELLELALVITRYSTKQRGSIEEIAEEIADVRITLRQIELLIGNIICSRAMDRKLLKLKQYLED